MKIRSIIRVVMPFLIIGAIVNILVMCAIAFLVNPFLQGWPTVGLYEDGWSKSATSKRELGTEVVELNFTTTHRLGGTADVFAKFWPAWAPADTTHGSDDALISHGFRFEARGWPFLTTWGTTRDIKSFATKGIVGDPAGAVELSGVWSSWTPATYPKMLPLRPIWTGVAGNTLFYALCAALIWWVIWILAWVRRIRRGWCPKCRYVRDGDYREPCPECGWTIRAIS